ncbi:MAG: glycosyltransferase family 2 protein [Lysobacterales bacterium]
MELSVVVPARNEAANVAALAHEIVDALRGHVKFEIIFVDDASDDASARIFADLMQGIPELRVLQHRQRAGQSAAIRNGVRAARADWIATLDGDGQNDPADLLRLVARRAESPAEIKLFAGWRTDRHDSASKRWASRFANALRARVLHDATPDTGCGTKLFERAAFLDLPYFDHMHRFLPALMHRDGWRTLSVPVNHRPRTAGTSNYNNLQRAWVGISDLRGVAWLIRRAARAPVDEISR